MFTEHDVQNAPRGHIRFHDTGVEVITNRIPGSNTLSLQVNVNGVMTYKVMLIDAFRLGLASGPKRQKGKLKRRLS